VLTGLSAFRNLENGLLPELVGTELVKEVPSSANDPAWSLEPGARQSCRQMIRGSQMRLCWLIGSEWLVERCRPTFLTGKAEGLGR
jgi:hypothetical protein